MSRTIQALVSATICALLACAMFGCSASTRISGPKASGVVTREVKQPDGTITTTREEVHSEGPTGQSSGTNEQLAVGGASPTATTDSGHPTLGSAQVKADGAASFGGGSTGRWIAGIIGLLLMLAGGAGLYLKQPLKAAIGTIAIGAVLLCSAIWINLALYILAGGAVYAAASLWLTGFDAAKFREASRAMLEGIDKLRTAHPEAHDLLVDPDSRRGLIASAASGSDAATIKKLAVKDNITIPS